MCMLFRHRQRTFWIGFTCKGFRVERKHFRNGRFVWFSSAAVIVATSFVRFYAVTSDLRSGELPATGGHRCSALLCGSVIRRGGLFVSVWLLRFSAPLEQPSSGLHIRPASPPQAAQAFFSHLCLNDPTILFHLIIPHERSSASRRRNPIPAYLHSGQSGALPVQNSPPQNHLRRLSR